MIFINQWRLPILFVVSGMGTWYALGFRTSRTYIKERLVRLGLPLIFGMLMIVPPQVYIERITNDGYQFNYLHFLLNDAFTPVYPEGNLSWHHLWFLPYLLFFSLILTPLFIAIKRDRLKGLQSWISNLIKKTWGLYVFIIPLYMAEAFMEPFFDVTLAFIGDWFALTNYCIFFLSGFLLLSTKNTWWDAVDQIKFKALVMGIVAFTMRLFIWNFIEDSTLVHFIEALITVVNIWSWILVIFGYGAKYLNKPSGKLTYANRAVYPFYIMHQTITIIIAYYLLKIDLSVYVEVAILTFGTFLFTYLLYEYMIRRIKWLWPVMGLK